ncbi:MAG TPA: sigma-70 family RNA polymerase sigma factor [Polyangiaceae bacterium]|nr:sigma-70 family RNA polymerase sigma factor [Polyangiaceae bacterium]
MLPERRKAIHDAILRLADGDRSAMPQLVADLWPVLLAFAKRGLRDQQDAEDVAQEVFLRICARVSEFDRTRDGVSWAFGIAAFEVMTQRRRLQRRRESYSTSGVAEGGETEGSAEDDALRAELRVRLTEALGQLSPEELANLGLGEATHAVAAIPAMRKRRQRALERLRIVWRRIYGEP